MTFNIRRVKLTDAEDLAKLYKQFWVPHKNVDPLLQHEKKMTLNDQIEYAKKEIRKRSNYIFVADLNGRVIGFVECVIEKNAEWNKIKKYVYLTSATTDKKHRGKGVAKALSNVALDFFKKKGFEYIRTKVYNSNEVATKTWTKLGFKPQSTNFIKKL